MSGNGLDKPKFILNSTKRDKLTCLKNSDLIISNARTQAGLEDSEQS